MSPNAKTKDKTSLFCPYLGLREDPGSLAAYPSPHNVCHRCSPPSVPVLHHQSSTCLTSNYATCPAQTDSALPHELILPSTNPRRPQQNTPIVWGAAVLLVGAILVAIVLFATKNNRPVVAAPLATATVDAALPAPQIRSTEVQPTPSNTPEPSPTATPSPIPTPTFTSEPQIQPGVHQLQSELGGDIKLIMYRILDGDQLPIVARRYQTSPEAVQAINFKSVYPLWVNHVIVIPLNTEDVTELPKFEAYEITDAQIDLQSLAEILGVDSAQIKYYNLCPQNCLVQKGDWVLLPRQP
jgi:hypothetical protein